MEGDKVQFHGSLTLYQMEMDGQIHAQTLYCRRKRPRYSLIKDLMSPNICEHCEEEKESKPDSSVVYAVAWSKLSFTYQSANILCNDLLSDCGKS
jgi:hypothetical protein